MDGSIQLTPDERKVLLRVYRSGDARVARGAKGFLWLDDGGSYRNVRFFLYARNDLIGDCVRRFCEGGIHQALEANGQAPPAEAAWLPAVLNCVQNTT